MGACAFLGRVWHTFKQLFLSTMHVQVCTLSRCLTSANTFAYTLAAGIAHALMYAQFVRHDSALGDEGGGVQIVYEGTCCLAWGVIFDRRRDRGVVCVFSIVNAGGSVCGCICVHTHTHTYTAGYSDVSPGVGMRHQAGSEESRWTKSRHICVRKCVQSTRFDLICFYYWKQ